MKDHKYSEEHKEDSWERVLHLFEPHHTEIPEKEIFSRENGWYFWDSDWEIVLGPYPTEEECRNEYTRYNAEEFDDGAESE